DINESNSATTRSNTTQQNYQHRPPKRRCSIRTSLLVPNENASVITILPLLMFPRVLDAIMLRTAATDPNRYGPIGQRQGARAKALTEWIGRIPGVKAVERVKLKSPSGRVLGDLDVVAIDPDLRRGIIFEVKWPIDAVTLNEALKTEEWIAAAASQLAGCRRLLNTPDSDVQFTFPSGWPELRDVEWEWCVCTPQQLSPRPLSEPDMTATSFRYLTSLAAPSSLDDIVKILRKPDYPKLGKHYAVERIRIELDRHVINMDAIGVLDIDWLPSCH
ncbi:hypothetical protein, partial [Nocardia sp. NPDC049526]|uniref:hypothetical protein n=1 Tax=Nocardia sp. NPDC049526 TaxID=3364316 RepID=UPI003787AEE2